ncbi:transaldolase [Leifsonia sp. NPDC056824]|uniref:transaldolase n=1 Tax=Leifsonia sp. NPDC056824 TaxID=3345953 RepID=UPI00367F29E4
MTATADLRRAGVSIWLDDLSRGDLVSGRLAELIRERDVTGVTTNPTIFAKAVEDDPDAYAGRLAELRANGAEPREAALALIAADVREACDVLRSVHEATGGADGFVSIEVTPDAAHDTAATLAEVRMLRALVDRPNVLVKIPSTDAGVRALEEATAEGASINMTLLFGLERYGQVMAAYRAGLVRAAATGIDLGGIRSVASFFVSRVDVEVDKRLSAIGGPVADGLRGLAAVANARLAYAAFEESLVGPEWQALAARGAHPQRPLWASTGVKDPAMRDTRYLEELVAPGVVDTIPAKTLEALHDHGVVRTDTIRGSYAESRAVLDDLERAGVRLADVTAELERAGIDAFGASWARLVAAIAE